MARRKRGNVATTKPRNSIDDNDSSNSTIRMTLGIILVEEGWCTSEMEATAILEASFSGDDDDEEAMKRLDNSQDSSIIRQNYYCTVVQEYLDLEERQLKRLKMILRIRILGNNNDDDQQDVDDGSDNDSSNNQQELLLDDSPDLNDDDDSCILGPGECHLCERYILLTKHHLIPRATWPRIEPMILHQLEAQQQQQQLHVVVPMEDSSRFQHLQLTNTTNSVQLHDNDDKGKKRLGRADIRRALQNTELNTLSICRPCHSTIHKTHDNMTLAQEYNTAEKLLNDPQIYKFCKWASKQKTGKYARS